MKLYTLPSSWKWATLSEVALPDKNAIVDGPFGSSLKTSDYKPNGVPVLQGKNITNSQFDWKEIRYISDEKANELIRSQVRLGDLLMVKIGSIGYSAYLDNLNDHDFAIIPANMAKISFDTRKIDKQYAWHWLNNPLCTRELNSVASKTAQPALSLSKIKIFPIPLPPLPEQKRIVAILDKADAIRRKRQQTIKLADDFLRATLLDMFGDPVTNPKGWQIRPLSEIVKKGRIVTYGIVQAGPPLPEGVPYIRTGDIQDGKINTSGLLKTSYEIASRYKRSEVNKGDIVMSIRATVGTVAPLPDELDGANLTQGTARISPGSRTNREFLLWTLKTRGIQNWIEKQVKGATFREITLAKLRELPLIVPPLESQEKFQSIVFQTQKLNAQINKEYNSCNEFFNSLTQRAFRGDL